MERTTIKTATIFVSVGKHTKVYHDMEEVPAPLRKKLIESTTGLNSATILIADRRGKQEIDRILRTMPKGISARLAETREIQEAELPKMEHPARAFVKRHWAALATLSASTVLLALASFWK